jgi:parvulin-like peptidyl-prolyl isomerase
MIRQITAFCCLFSLILVLAGCGAKEQTVGETAATPEKPEPERVTVQHILIAFEGTVPGKNITRSKEEAQALAEELFGRARKGEDFDALVKQYTDDAHPGIYAIVNHGGEANPEMQIFARETMVPSFGDVAFSLEAGDIGLARYDEEKSKYGWHIIKRLR